MKVKKSVVDHTYRDYSKVDISELVVNYRGLNKEVFPSKLHEMLSTPEYAHIISWRPHGRAWEVVNRSLFISVVLPKYFNHRNFESFNRSVNMWGFKVRFLNIFFHSDNVACYSAYSLPIAYYDSLFIVIALFI